MEDRDLLRTGRGEVLAQQGEARLVEIRRAGSHDLGNVALRFLAWIEQTITSKPKAVLIVAAAISLMAAGMGTRAGKEYFSYDDLRPNNPLARNIRYLETMHGGSVPFAIYIEPKDPAARRYV